MPLMTNAISTYPQHVPLKVMGHSGPMLRAALDTTLARHLAPGTPIEITRRESRNGRYTAYTVTFIAASREQLMAIYTELRRCDTVRFLL